MAVRRSDKALNLLSRFDTARGTGGVTDVRLRVEKLPMAPRVAGWGEGEYAIATARGEGLL